MTHLKSKEDINQTKKNTNKKSVAIGIDFGTTCSSIFIEKISDITPEQIEGTQGDYYVQSIVFVGENGEIIVGKAANQYATNRIIIDNKRFLGQKYSTIRSNIDVTRYPYQIVPGPDDSILYKLQNTFDPSKSTTISPFAIATEILKYIKEIIDDRLRTDEPRIVIITVPCYFNSCQKQSTLGAGMFFSYSLFSVTFSL